MSEGYGFVKIGKLKWREIGFWSESQIVNAARSRINLKRKYPNAAITLKKVSIIEVTTEGPFMIEDESGEEITLFITFKNKADEAEFILREGIN